MLADSSLSQRVVTSSASSHTSLRRQCKAPLPADGATSGLPLKARPTCHCSAEKAENEKCWENKLWVMWSHVLFRCVYNNICNTVRVTAAVILHSCLTTGFVKYLLQINKDVCTNWEQEKKRKQRIVACASHLALSYYWPVLTSHSTVLM